MPLDSPYNTCNKSASYRNSAECNLCLNQTHFKCNNLNFVVGQVIRNANKSWFCLQCSKKTYFRLQSYKQLLTYLLLSITVTNNLFMVMT